LETLNWRKTVTATTTAAAMGKTRRRRQKFNYNRKGKVGGRGCRGSQREGGSAVTGRRKTGTIMSWVWRMDFRHVSDREDQI
jgi:hypothetical protein